MHSDPEELDIGVYLSACYAPPWQGDAAFLGQAEVQAEYCGVLVLSSEKPAYLWDEEELSEWAKEVLVEERQFREWEILQIDSTSELGSVLSQDFLDQGTLLGIQIQRAEILEQGAGAYGQDSLDFETFRMQGEGAPEYYAQLQAKHFSSSGTGSVFLHLDHPDKLIRLALLQNGLTDSREQITALGIAPDTMLADRKYVLVRTPGLDGSWRAGDLNPDMPVRTTILKGGVVDLVADLPRRTTDVATMILTPDNRLITAFPGLPARPMDHGLESGLTVQAGDLDPCCTVLASSAL